MQTSPYGSWRSPVTSDLITTSSIRLSSVQVAGDAVFWIESRPSEGGRNVVVSRGLAEEYLTPTGFNVRTLAHEYGGGAYTIHENTIYFVNYQDQRIFRQAFGSAPEPLSQPIKAYFADLIVDAPRNRLICVQEDHTVPNEEAITSLVSVSLSDGSIEMIVAGNDFYASPRLSPNGMFLAWISWNHPNMPWDETSLWAANVGRDGSLANIRKIAGEKKESVVQPEWSPEGELFYVSDRSGWWNLYKHTDYEGEFAVCAKQAEFAQPMWTFGQSSYAFASKDRLIAAYSSAGTWKLSSINLDTGTSSDFDLDLTEFSYVRANSKAAYFIAGSPTMPQAVRKLDLADGKYSTLRESMSVQVDSGYISRPQPIEFPTTGGKTAHAFFYAPCNKDYQAPAGSLPPLIVKSHGGPTSATSSTLNLGIQYWTSRGFSVVDVNYGGSTGYGREYRDRLLDSWGIVDVDDCCNAAKFLAQQGKVDPQRLAISGGSAGGYTTLCALTFRDVFKAGASYYGISDLEALEKDTHKFEAKYSHRLVGPYPAAKKIYIERSPIHHALQLKCPVIFLQGLEDRVVSPAQSEKMVQALKKNGVPVAYLTFEGEQHGFRKAENIKRALDAELYFYSKIFNFDLPDQVQPVEIDNLQPASSRR